MIRKEHVLFFLIIGLGLFIRVWKINIPLLEFYPSRQVQTAEITRNFIKNDFNLLNPSVSYFGPGYTPFLIEFPGFNFAVAVIYHFFGVNEIYGRLASLVGWVVSVFLLYKIALRLSTRTSALIAIFFYTLSPLSVLVSRSFQPDQWMLTLSLAAIYFILLWAEGTTLYFYLSAIIASFSILIKIPSLIFTLVPIFFVLVKSRKDLFKLNNYIYLLISISPTLTWYVFSFFKNKASLATSGNFTLSNWFGFEVFLNPSYYTNTFGFEYNLVLLPIGTLLFTTGLFMKLHKKQYILYSWLVGVILYFLVFNKHNMTHEYYHLPLVPIASIFIGIALEKILERLKNVFISRGIFLAIFSFLIFLLMFPPTLARAYKPIERFAHVKETAAAIKKYTNPYDLIIGSMDGGQSLVYYAERHGWQFTVDRKNAETEFNFYGVKNAKIIGAVEELENLREQGAVIFASAYKKQFLANQDFSVYMYSKYTTLVDNDDYIIFDLKSVRN